MGSYGGIIIMYLDLYDELHVNKRLMKLFGIEAAVYLAELVSIGKHVLKKRTCDEHGFFPLDRAYVESETTLKPETQVMLDSQLSKIGVIQVSPTDPNRILLGLNKLSGIIAGITEQEISSEIKQLKVDVTAKKDGKKFGLIKNLKAAVSEADPELRTAYDTWIQAIVENMIDNGKGKVTKVGVQKFVSDIRSYTQDKQNLLNIINIATVYCYMNSKFAISIHEDSLRKGRARAAAPTIDPIRPETIISATPNTPQVDLNTLAAGKVIEY